MSGLLDRMQTRQELYDLIGYTPGKEGLPRRGEGRSGSRWLLGKPRGRSKGWVARSGEDGDALRGWALGERPRPRWSGPIRGVCGSIGAW